MYYFSVQICDFGFIKSVGTGAEALSRTYCGSKSYAAPEILTGVPYDPKKSDIWAVGVILYIFVTGKMPFDETKGTKSILEEQRQLNFHWAKSAKRIPSLACQALIRRMFIWEFTTRPAINVILGDIWFSLNDTSMAAPPPRTGGNASPQPKKKGADDKVPHTKNDCLSTVPVVDIPVAKTFVATETKPSRRGPAVSDN